MTVRSLSIAAAAAAVGVVALAPTAAVAATARHCDAYSHHCVPVQPTKVTKPPTVVKGEKITLPFTGAEVVLMTTVGGGALGAGVAIAVAGRRKRAQAS